MWILPVGDFKMRLSQFLRTVRNMGTLPALGLLVAAQCGCDTIGPRALRQSRPDYNEVIEETNKYQNFLNLVRAREHEPTLFMDVSEVDVGLQFQAALTSTFNLPQMNPAGHDYVVGGSAQYQETPTIRYTPLLGQGLVAQLATPINVDSIAWLIDSECPVSSVLNLTAIRLAPSDADYYEALDAIMALYKINALFMVPARADPTTSSSDDTLVLYCVLDRIRDLQPGHEVNPDLTGQATKLWHKLWCIYGSSQPPGICETDYRIELRTNPKPYPIVTPSYKKTRECDDAPTTAPSSPAVTKPYARTFKNTDETDTAGVAAQQFHSLSDCRPYQLVGSLRTRSAVGILRDVTQPDLDWDLAVFVSPEKFEKLRPMIKHFDDEVMFTGLTRDFYVFDSAPFTGIAYEKNDEVKTDGDPWHKPQRFEPADDLLNNGAESYQDYYEEQGYPERGDRMRHYLIVVRQDQSIPAPPTAYVSAICNGHRFYIDGDDVVSQRNLSLISNLLVIQSTAQPAPLTPTISVGGGSAGH